MKIRRITISVPEQVAGRIKNAAGSPAVSAWVTDLIAEPVNDTELERQWSEFYRDVAPKRAEIGCADQMFTRLMRRSHRQETA